MRKIQSVLLAVLMSFSLFAGAGTIEENKKAGAAFLAENGKKEGVKTTESGLQYLIVKEGTGKSPKATDQVKVDYAGTNIAGEEFDSNRGIVFPLNRVIKGWTEGVQLMKEGAEYRFFIPSDLAYGDRGAGRKIGPGETLLFDVKLIEVK